MAEGSLSHIEKYQLRLNIVDNLKIFSINGNFNKVKEFIRLF